MTQDVSWDELVESVKLNLQSPKEKGTGSSEAVVVSGSNFGIQEFDPKFIKECISEFEMIPITSMLEKSSALETLGIRFLLLMANQKL